MIDILETCTVLLEKQVYPVTLIELLATFSMRAMLQDSVNATEKELSQLDGLLHTPCLQRLLKMTDEYQLLAGLVLTLDQEESASNRLSARELMH